MPDSLSALAHRLDILAGSLERARKYGTGLILFVVYRAETARADLERRLLNRLEATSQRARRVQFHPDDPPEAADLLGRLQAEPPAEDEVVLVYDLRHALPDLLNSLNYRREFVPEGSLATSLLGAGRRGDPRYARRARLLGLCQPNH